MRKLLPLLLLLSISTTAYAADTLRVCTWNILNYSISNDDGRTVSYKKILDEIQPDVIVVQEMVESAAAEKFAADVLNSRWLLSPFIDGPDTDNMLYYDQDKLILHQTTSLTTALRHITEYVLQVRATGDTLRIFSAHLKANDDEQAARDAETQALQSRLQQIASWGPTNIIVAGDMNFYSVTEPAYQRLTATLVDPLGGWIRNTEAQAIRYTQSTRTAADAACGGGTTGGVDDRFDFILTSGTLTPKYVPGTYTAFGNDGQPRLNASIDDPPNTAVSADMATALRCASDHLPVFADFAFDATTSVPEQFASTGFRIYPMPVTDESVIEIQSPASGARMSIVDMLGREVYSVEVGGRNRVPLPKLAAGVYKFSINNYSTLIIK